MIRYSNKKKKTSGFMPYKMINEVDHRLKMKKLKLFNFRRKHRRKSLLP